VWIVEINGVNLFSNGQTKVDYMIGLRSGDIGDYSQPSERLYTQVFNQTGLQTLVYVRYIPRSSNDIILNNDPTATLPFYYRSGPFYGVKFRLNIIDFKIFSLAWMVGYFASCCWYINYLVNFMFNLLCLLSKTVRFYFCFSSFLLTLKLMLIYLNRSRISSHNHQIYKPTARRIDILSREQNPYYQSSAFHRVYNEPQRASAPELQVRRLSQQDWPYSSAYNPYALPSASSYSSSSIRSNEYHS
jgi:hypothetical protein